MEWTESLIKGLIFDLDDTLYPERDFVFSGYRAVSEAVQREHDADIYDELVALFQSGARGDLFTPVLERHLDDVRESYVKKLVEVYRSHEPDIDPYPDAIEALGQLTGWKALGIVTDGWLEVQKKKVEALGIAPYFDAIVYTDSWGKAGWKPSAKGYLESAARLSVEPGCLAYIGDNPRKDFVTAKSLGFTTVRVRRRGGLHSDVTVEPEYEAKFEVDNLISAVDIIAETTGK